MNAVWHEGAALGFLPVVQSRTRLQAQIAPNLALRSQAHVGSAKDAASSPCLPATLPAAAHSFCVQLDQVDLARSLGSSTHSMRGASSNAIPVRHTGCVRAVKQPLHCHKQGLGRDYSACTGLVGSWAGPG